MLTRRQRDLLLFIHDYTKARGISPSFGEMTDAMGLVSKANIFRLLNALEERGFIRRFHRRSRAIEVVRLPEQPSDGHSGPDVLSALDALVSSYDAGRFPAAKAWSAARAAVTAHKRMREQAAWNSDAVCTGKTLSHK
jgi:repressor LexA